MSIVWDFRAEPEEDPEITLEREAMERQLAEAQRDLHQRVFGEAISYDDG